MQQLLSVLIIVIFNISSINAQISNHDSLGKSSYSGAIATKPSYHAIYQLETNDIKTVEKAFHNIKNLLADPRLIGKIEIELVTLGAGTDVVMKGNKYQETLKLLSEKGVIIAQYNNTLKDRKISPIELYDFVAIVPSGNGELVIRQADGWAIIKP